MPAILGLEINAFSLSYENAPNYRKLQKQLTFDNLMLHLWQRFDLIEDHRRAKLSYALGDVLAGAFAMFALKSPSLLSFQEQTRVERGNLKQVFRLGDIPADSQMRATLDRLDPENLRRLLPTLVERLDAAGVLKEYQYRQRHLIVSVDGVEHFSSRKVHCDNCTSRTGRSRQLPARGAGSRPRAPG